MPAVNCKYHTSTPARWYCNHCQISFCPGCVTETESGQAPDCPVCKRQLSSLGSENLVTPFWARLREFFIYPASPGPLLLILTLSAITFLIGQVPAAWTVHLDISIWRIDLIYVFLFPFLVVFLNYACNVLIGTAHGYLKPLAITTERLFGHSILVFEILLLILVFELFQIAARILLHEPGYHLASVITSLITPAVIMVLAIEKNFFNAINPVAVTSMITRIGMPYFIMFMLFYLLGVGQDYLMEILLRFIDQSFSLAVYAFVTMYFYLIMFNMMGYTLYQHHGVLGYSIDVEMHQQEDDSQFNTVNVSPEMRAVEILIHEGQTDQAMKELQAIVSKNPSDTDARDRILKLTRLSGNTALHAQQAQSYISYLIDENKLGQAALVFESCYEYDKSLKPTKAAERLEMAKYFRKKSKYKLATAILNDLHRDFPSFDGIPQAYLIVAQTLCEQFNDDERAQMILEFVIKNYPSHPLIPEVEEYLKIVRELSNH
jgi:tetratricopeptide (TPR) repeat protein